MSKSLIIKASILITIVSFLGRIMGFFREILFANYYGLNEDYEIYLVASIIPITINTISIFFYQNYFIPNYAIFQKETSGRKDYFAKRTLRDSVLISIFITIILLLFSKQILNLYIGSVFYNTKFTDVFLIFSLTIIPSIISSFLSAYINSNYKFGAPAFSLLFINITTILALMLFKTSNIVYIAYGYLLGTIIQMVYLIFHKDVLSLIKTKTFETKIEWKIPYLSIITILSIELIGQLYMVADRYFFPYVESGGIASLHFATNIFLLPVTIFTISISTAIMPDISRLSVKKNIEELKELLSQLITFSFYFFIPIFFSLIFFGDKLIKIFLERGAFDSNSTNLTFNVLFYLSFSLIFYVIYGFLNKYLYTLQKITFLFFITITILIIKFILNYIFVFELKQNGLAISTAISYILFFSFSYYKVKKEISFEFTKKLFEDLVFYLVNSFFSYLITMILTRILGYNTFFNDTLYFICFITIYVLNNQTFYDRNQKRIFHYLKIIK